MFKVLSANCLDAKIYFLQVKSKDEWKTLYASSMLADIKHACQEGFKSDEKWQAYCDFMHIKA